MAGYRRRPADGCRQDYGALPPAELRTPGSRPDGRRSQGLHQAVVSQGEPDSRCRYRLAGVYMFGKRKGYTAHECRSEGGWKCGEMKTVAALIAALAVPLSAQWLNYPTPGVPRTVDGTPNLSAPTPRTADGKPDLSGVWDS